MLSKFKFMVILLVAIVVSFFLGALSFSALSEDFIFRFVIKGNVDVPKPFIGITLTLNITESKGEKSFKNVAVIDLREARLIKVNIKGATEGDVKICLNGFLVLERVSDGKIYTISMPCMYVKDMKCARVMTIIPGYDTPIKVEAGMYVITLNLYWIAEGSGKVGLVIDIVAI